MLQSAEVRWFFTGHPDARVLETFQVGTEVGEETRTDHYLLFDGNDSLGFKLRETAPGLGVLELKVRVTAPRLVRFHDGQAGHAARWSKWSSSPLPLPEVAHAVPGGGNWIRVDKARRLRKLAASREPFVEVDPSSRLAEGCTYELAILQVRAAEWWTLALEAFGPAGALEERLRLAGDWFFARWPPRHRLTAAASQAYPSWFARLGEPRAAPSAVRAPPT